jgi:hypothetical protein
VKAWLSWLCTRSPWLALGLFAVLAAVLITSVHVITSSSYRLALHWDSGGLELSPAHP